MTTSAPASNDTADIIHFARRAGDPTACEADGPAAIEWRYVTCPACLALAPAGEQAPPPRPARSTIVGRPLVMDHKPTCAALADPPAACNCH